MADRKRELDKIDALYQWIAHDLQRIRGELLKEMRYSTVQVGSLYQEMKADKDKSASAIAQEIRYSYKQNQTIYDGLAAMLTKEVGDRLNSVDEKVTSLEQLQTLLSEVREVKYSYMQLQAIYEGLTSIISGDVVSKLNVIEEKEALLEQVDRVLGEVNAKLADGFLPTEEDYKKISDSVAERMEESLSEYSRQLTEVIEKNADNIKYDVIADEVGDKLLEILNELKSVESDAQTVTVAPAAPVEVKIDYDKIINGAAEKVVESLPYPEKINYKQIEEAIAASVASQAINYEALAEAVAAKVVIPEINYDLLAETIATKIAPPAINYDQLADVVVAKLANGTEQSIDVVLDEAGLAQIAEKVSEKLNIPEAINYDRVCEAMQAVQEPQVMPEPVDYDRIAEIVEDKLANNESNEETTYDLVIDEEGINAIAKGVSEEICRACANCEVPCEEAEAVEEAAEAVVEEVVEETVEDVVEEVVEEVAEEAPVEEVVAEETVEEVVEEVAEEPIVEEAVEESVVEEVVEEPAVEEVVEEPVVEVAEEPVAEAPVETAQDELAVALNADFDEINNQLVDAETGLVIRLKKSFTAKMKQSEEKVKGYYSDLKNELTSYKRINSNVSWHGDRFNFGRETVAKINICGKTLCFYLALDPNDPEYKSTVYHQKDVGGQKAYENTPFMVKVKSDAAAKKALRLVGYLAEKLGTDKKEGFEATDYVEEFGYESTKQLFDGGYIKATKEKKVDLDF